MPASTRTIWITGAGSYSAQRLIPILLEDKETKLILSGRHPEQLVHNGHERCKPVTFDLRDSATAHKIISDHQVTDIIHLAAMARLSEGEAHPAEAIRINLLASLCLADLAERHQLRSLIFTSSDLARNATSVVGRCKFLVEERMRTITSLPLRRVVIRMTNIIDSPGAVTHIFRRQILAGEPLTITHPRMSRRFIGGDEAAMTLKHAFLNGQDASLWVSTAPATNISDLAGSMMKDMGKTVPITYIGARPGERLEEPGYRQSQTVATGRDHWGMLQHHQTDDDQARQHLLILSALAADDHDMPLSLLLKQLALHWPDHKIC